MSKVTGKDLERLIEGALSERTNIDIKGATLPDLRKKLGLPSDSKITKKKIQSVAGLRNPPHAFKYDDMAAAYFQGQKSPSFDPYETSIDVAGTTDDETIKSDLEDAGSCRRAAPRATCLTGMQRAERMSSATTLSTRVILLVDKLPSLEPGRAAFPTSKTCNALLMVASTLQTTTTTT